MSITNAQIIMNNSIELMKNGIISGTGEYMTVEYPDGRKETLEIPEQIHTFESWKAAGRIVKRGEKAKAAFEIWKYVKNKQAESENSESDPGTVEIMPGGHCFMKKAFFFTINQTEPITAK